MHALEETIVAVSSPPGRSLRSLIRLSGPRARAIVGNIVEGRLPPPGRIEGVRLRLASDQSAAGVDPGLRLPALVACFCAPASYTGQDVVELQVPGHPALLEGLLHLFYQLGAEPAAAGEFTFRAFLNGKMDLTQAEGVAATIAAQSQAELAAAGRLRRGELGELARKQVEALSRALALVEAGIDFSDQEDVHPIRPGELEESLRGVRRHLAELLERAQSWSALRQLPRVVLVGLPNVGKSTLFNALIGQQRALTSPIPGTTRDVLEHPLKLEMEDGRAVEVIVVDIAGLDEAESALDRQVQEAARRAIAGADLILLVSERREDLQASVRLLESLQEQTGLGAKEVPVVRVLSKCDLHPEVSREGWTAVSAHTGQGLAELKGAMFRALRHRPTPVSETSMVLTARQSQSIRRALEALEQAERLLEPQREEEVLDQPEVLAELIRSALHALEELGGAVTPEDVLERIFAAFCIGK